MLKRLCGTELDESPTVVLSPGHEVTHVVFKSDHSINNRGFNVSYQVPNNVLFHMGMGKVQSCFYKKHKVKAGC